MDKKHIERLKQLALNDYYYNDADQDVKDADDWLASNGYANIHNDEVFVTVTSITDKGRALLRQERDDGICD